MLIVGSEFIHANFNVIGYECMCMCVCVCVYIYISPLNHREHMHG